MTDRPNRRAFAASPADPEQWIKSADAASRDGRPADEPPPLLHPSMAELFRSRVQQLYDALQDEDEEKRTEAADIISTLVEDIVLTPVDGSVEIDVRGDLAGILRFPSKRKTPPVGRGHRK